MINKKSIQDFVAWIYTREEVTQPGHVLPDYNAYKLASLVDEYCASQVPASTGKTLHNSDVNGAKKNVKDIVVFGDGDLFQLLSKASSEEEGWMKSSKAMPTPLGCLVQVTTQQRNPDGSYAVAEALTFVPGAIIISNAAGIRLGSDTRGRKR